MFYLKLSTSLFAGHDGFDLLGSSVGLVHQSHLSKKFILQISTVMVVGRLTGDDFFYSTKVLVNGSGNITLLGLSVALGGCSGHQNGLVVIVSRKGNISSLGIGNTRVLELVQGFDISFFDTECDGTGTTGPTVLLLGETSIAAGKFPH